MIHQWSKLTGRVIEEKKKVCIKKPWHHINYFALQWIPLIKKHRKKNANPFTIYELDYYCSVHFHSIKIFFHCHIPRGWNGKVKRFRNSFKDLNELLWVLLKIKVVTQLVKIMWPDNYLRATCFIAGANIRNIFRIIKCQWEFATVEWEFAEFDQNLIFKIRVVAYKIAFSHFLHHSNSIH